VAVALGTGQPPKNGCTPHSVKIGIVSSGLLCGAFGTAEADVLLGFQPFVWVNFIPTDANYNNVAAGPQNALTITPQIEALSASNSATGDGFSQSEISFNTDDSFSASLGGIAVADVNLAGTASANIQSEVFLTATNSTGADQSYFVEYGYVVDGLAITNLGSSQYSWQIGWEVAPFGSEIGAWESQSHSCQGNCDEFYDDNEYFSQLTIPAGDSATGYMQVNVNLNAVVVPEPSPLALLPVGFVALLLTTFSRGRGRRKS